MFQNFNFRSLVSNKRAVLFNVMAIISAFIIFSSNGKSYNFIVLLVFFLICLVSLYGIFKSIDQVSFSLNKTFHIFYYFFFGIAPAVQFKFGSAFYNAPKLTENDYLKGGVILMVLLILYLIFYKLTFIYFNKKSSKLNTFKEVKSQIWEYYFLSIGAFITVVVIVKFNLNILFFRPEAAYLKYNTNFGFIGYSILLISRGIPIIVLLRYLLIGNKNKKHIVILGMLALFTAFPSSLSRGLIAAYYIPFIVFLSPIKKSKVYYTVLYFVGVFIVFPLLNFFRNSNNEVFFGVATFKTGHFDAFQNFVLLINEQIITGGRQLLGAILFFVQESSWANKPLGTGALLGSRLDFNHLNIAMPYFGEGYANFGFVGMFMFLVIIVLLNAFLDLKFHTKSSTVLFKIMYLFLLGFEFYILRGDLYSSVSKGTSFILALIAVQIFMIVIKKVSYQNAGLWLQTIFRK